MTRLDAMTDVDVQVVAHWLGRKENHQWLDFGRGRQILDALALTMMRQSTANHLRMLRGDTGDPVGVIALSELSEPFKSAVLWYVIGDDRARGQGHATRGVAAMLDEAFGRLGLHAIHAWTVASNLPSIRVLEKNGFRLIGRQRECHNIDGLLLDRLLFDRLSTDA